MTTNHSTLGEVAGYRIMRRLGRGRRADVFLATSPGEGDESPRAVAVKLFNQEVGIESIGAELEALSRSSLPHCCALLDVASTDNGLPAAVLARVSRGSVSRLLRERGVLEPGEVVTLLAPLALLLNALHQAGVAHTAIGAGKVHLTDAGEPVLLGFGAARLLAPGSPPAVLDEDSAVLGDRALLANLALLVLDHVPPGRGSAAAEDVSNWIRGTQRRDFGFAPELAERLFSLAPAAPIEFLHTAGGSSDPVPSRLGPVGALPGATDPHAAAPSPSRPAWLVALHLPGWADELLGDRPFDLVRERLKGAMGSVRRPTWLLGGGVALALVAALVTTTHHNDSDGSIEAPVSPVTATPGALTQGAMLPDDPVAALPQLLAARELCIRDLSVLCLDGVHQLGSAAMTDDSLLIRRILSGEASPQGVVRPAGSAELVERLGDSALVNFGTESTPASVLMIRSEAGWRIRAFLAPASLEP